jgi:hypothetical protein
LLESPVTGLPSIRYFDSTLRGSDSGGKSGKSM